MGFFDKLKKIVSKDTFEDKKEKKKEKDSRIEIKEEYIAIGGIVLFLLLVLWLKHKQK